MLKRALLRLAMIAGCFIALVVAWLGFSLVCLSGTSLLLIADPGMVTREMIYISMVAGALALVFSLVASFRGWLG